jgi:Trk-type K+ transport system membrane component
MRTVDGGRTWRPGGVLTGHLDGFGSLHETFLEVTPRAVRIVLIVLLVALALLLIGAVLFKLDGEEPGSGTGETITGLSTP